MPTRTLIPLLLFTATPIPTSGPPPDEQAPKELIELRSQLFEAGEKARSQIPRFRSLCDEDGYPLVGNVVRKAKLFQPSEFCSVVREREGGSDS